MKKTRKLLSVLLAMLLLAGSLSCMAAAKTSEEADTHLQFNDDGTFKIIQFADMQDGFPQKLGTKKIIQAAIEREQPDLIVLTGDNISAGSGSKLAAKLAINEYMAVFEAAGIPVAAVFGNHDDERTPADKAYQMSVYESYDCFVGCAGEDFGDTNLGTYYVPVYSSSDPDKMVFNVWMTDSGNYNSENDLGGYACTTKAQIDWYVETSEKLERENGGKVPSFMFQHIVVPEIYDALCEVEEGTEGAIGHGGKYYVLPENATGEMNESPCPPNYSNGQFDAVVSRGDVLAMFFGHDHINTYDLEYQGVHLINSAGTGFNSYDGDVIGYRAITIHEDDPWSFETEAYSYFDIFDYEDDAARYLYKMSSDTTDTATKIASFFKYVAAVIKATLGR